MNNSSTPWTDALTTALLSERNGGRAMDGDGELDDKTMERLFLRVQYRVSKPALDRLETAKRAFLQVQTQWERQNQDKEDMPLGEYSIPLLRPEVHLTRFTWTRLQEFVKEHQMYKSKSSSSTNKHPHLQKVWRVSRRKATPKEKAQAGIGTKKSVYFVHSICTVLEAGKCGAPTAQTMEETLRQRCRSSSTLKDTPVNAPAPTPSIPPSQIMHDQSGLSVLPEPSPWQDETNQSSVVSVRSRSPSYSSSSDDSNGMEEDDEGILAEIAEMAPSLIDIPEPATVVGTSKSATTATTDTAQSTVIKADYVYGDLVWHPVTQDQSKPDTAKSSATKMNKYLVIAACPEKSIVTLSNGAPGCRMDVPANSVRMFKPMVRKSLSEL